MSWDAFISHASEDKEFVRSLADELRTRGVKIWYDEYTLKPGDSLRRSIDYGLQNSRFGIVVLSRNFFRKEWTQRELDGLTTKEITGRKVILPVWHGIDSKEVAEFSLVLADRLGVLTSHGVSRVADQLLQVIEADEREGLTRKKAWKWTDSLAAAEGNSDKKTNDRQEHVVGIDLGTSHSRIAVAGSGWPSVVPNSAGNRETDTIFGIDPNTKRLHVGDAVKRNFKIASSVLDLVGIDFEDDRLSTFLEFASFETRQSKEGKLTIWLDGEWYTPSQLLCRLVSSLKCDAERHLDNVVSKAIVSVPALFDEVQRQTIRDIVDAAGLEVVRLINAPVASCISYNVGEIKNGNTFILDFGGGTLDACVMEISESSIFNVLAYGGDLNLGGDNFDYRLMEWIIDGFPSHHKKELKTNRYVIGRIKREAEYWKKELSYLHQVEVTIPYRSKGKASNKWFRKTLSRASFENLIALELGRLREVILDVLSESRVRASQIDNVVLVGGQSRSPIVQKVVKDVFSVPILIPYHSAHSVAIGSAIYGEILIKTR